MRSVFILLCVLQVNKRNVTYGAEFPWHNRTVDGRNWVARVLEVVYADTAVSHILTSKAIPQPIHEHILIDAAMYAIILSKMYKVPLPFKGKERDVNKEQIREKNF